MHEEPAVVMACSEAETAVGASDFSDQFVHQPKELVFKCQLYSMIMEVRGI